MFKRYLRETSGQFAIMFGIASTALLVGVGVAVDYAGMTRQVAQLQSISDTAALAAAASGEENLSQLRTVANDIAGQNNDRYSDLSLDLGLADNIITVEVSATYKTNLLGILGITEKPLKVISQAPLPRETPYNIALVLDTTGSMSGAKIEALKVAAKGFVDIFDGFGDDTVKVGVVPFAEHVNVGLSRRNKNWIDVPADSIFPLAETCYMKRDKINPDACYYEETTAYNDGVPYTYNKQICPIEAYGPEYEYCYIPMSSQTWHGCVGSRDDGDHMDPDYRGKRIPAVMNEACGAEIMPLTDNMPDVKAHIDSLTAGGATYTPAGLMWGWRMLDKDKPLDDLTNSQTDRKRALVLMSDGENTVKLDAPQHWGFTPDHTNAASMKAETDTDMRNICASIKSEGIELYTVAYAFGTGPEAAAAKSLIRDCASNPSLFFEATDANSLEDAFEDIGNALFTVRLSR